jgi:hypothetical protein
MSLLQAVGADFIGAKRELTSSVVKTVSVEVSESIVVENLVFPNRLISIDAALPSITLTDGVNTNVITSVGGGGTDKLLLTNATALAGAYYPTFADALTGYEDQYTSSNLVYSPSTNTLTCPNFAGNASTASTAATINSADTGIVGIYNLDLSGTGPNQSVRTNTSLTFNASTNTLTCPNFAGNASTAATITTADTGNVGTYSVDLSGTGSNQSVRTDTSLTYDANTNTLSVPALTNVVTINSSPLGAPFIVTHASSSYPSPGLIAYFGFPYDLTAIPTGNTSRTLAFPRAFRITAASLIVNCVNGNGQNPGGSISLYDRTTPGNPTSSLFSGQNYQSALNSQTTTSLNITVNPLVEYCIQIVYPTFSITNPSAIRHQVVLYFG